MFIASTVGTKEWKPMPRQKAFLATRCPRWCQARSRNSVPCYVAGVTLQGKRTASDTNVG
jgi:hypothetical protein